MSRGELIQNLAKQVGLSRRYKRKLADLVTAYKDMTTSNKKLELALESHQDKASKRAQEQAGLHKREMETKDRLSDAVRTKLVDVEAQLGVAVTDVAALKLENEVLREGAAGLATTRDASEQETLRLQQRVAELEAQAAATAAQLDSGKEASAGMSAELKQLRGRAESLEVALKQKDIDLTVRPRSRSAIGIASTTACAFLLGLTFAPAPARAGPAAGERHPPWFASRPRWSRR